LRGPTYPDPALIGGFGKIKIQMQNYTTLESKENHKNNLERLRSKLGPSVCVGIKILYTSTNSVMNPFYVTGFTDAEGCFNLYMSNTRSKN
jgi:hypothetical protein